MDASSAVDIEDMVRCTNVTAEMPAVLTADFSNSCLEDSENKAENETPKITENSISSFVNGSISDEVQTDDSPKLREMLLSIPVLNQTIENTENENMSDDSSFYVMIDGDTVKRVDAGNLDLSKTPIEHFEIRVADEDSSHEMKNNNHTFNNVHEPDISPEVNGNCVEKCFPTGAEGDIQRLQHNYKINSYDNLNNEENNLDNSLGEENILVHLSKQQQQYLCSAMNIDQDR